MAMDSSTNNNNIVSETDEVFYFPEGSLRVGEDNVITIVQVGQRRMPLFSFPSPSSLLIAADTLIG